MKNIDTNVAARQLWLRQLQGLPTAPPDGYTIIRQSDFERSTVWRAVFIAAVIVIGVSLFQPSQFDALVKINATA
jgi:hypothetical protein